MGQRDAGHVRSVVLRTVVAAVVLALVAAAGVAWRYDVRNLAQAQELVQGWLGSEGDRAETDPASVAAPEALSLPDPAAPVPVAVPSVDQAVLDRAAVRRALQRGLADEDLGPRTVAAVASLSGDEPVFARGAGRRFIPASTMKLLTAAAAIEVLGADRTFSTRVVQGKRPRQVILVGGGDPLLAGSAPTPQERAQLYPERADIETLAQLTAAALLGQGRKKVRLGYDTSLFSGPGENPRWRADYIPDGVVSPITSLWIDQGRPGDGRPGRVADPALAAAFRFGQALEVAGIRVVGEPAELVAPDAAAELASVDSAPVGQIAQRVLDVSDNEASEVLAHHVGIEVSGEGSFVAAADAVVTTLRRLGVPMVRDKVYDGSGLSRQNRLTATTLIAVLQLAAERPDLREVLTGLPVAGFTGSLASRFDAGPVEGLGRVRAKTGTLTGVHGLAGTAVDLDGNSMAFVLLADRVAVEDTLDARERLDQLAAALAACHCSG